MFKNISIVVLMVISSITFAGAWTAELTVRSIMTEGTTDVIAIYTEDSPNYVNACSSNNWIFIADTDARRSRVYSTVLTAMMSGKKIQLWYTDECSHWNYHGAKSLRIVK